MSFRPVSDPPPRDAVSSGESGDANRKHCDGGKSTCDGRSCPGVLLLSTGSSQGDDRLLDWVKVTPRSARRARDSAGELVHRDRLWLIGGWFDSFSWPPRDVEFPGRGDLDARYEGGPVEVQRPADVPQLRRPHVAHGWLARWTAPRPWRRAEVWLLIDGANWTMVTKEAGWSPRLAAGSAVSKGGWILGGTENYYFGDDASLKNDVWSSADGKDWRRETARTPGRRGVSHRGRARRQALGTSET